MSFDFLSIVRARERVEVKGRSNRKALMMHRCHMFYEKRVIDILDRLPKWSGMQGKSDLIEDSPAEDVKKRKKEIEEEEKDEREGKSSKE